MEAGIARARSQSALPAAWITRTERLGALGVKTYVAALGGALLAKATDPRVDSLVQDETASARGYSLRRAAEYLAVHNEGRYHLGTASRWPLNNRPFLGGPARIDEFTKISRRARPAFQMFLDSLIALNRLDSEEALNALSAFLCVRMAVAERERTAIAELFTRTSGLTLEDVLGMAELFVRENPEHGRRGQAFVAAAFDCAFDSVQLQSINNPKPGDVRVVLDGKTVPIEVKQIPVASDRALELAREARRLGGDAALLVALADKQEPLDRDRIRRTAIREIGVAVEVCESVRELVGLIAVFASASIEEIVSSLPAAFAARMQEIEVSDAGLRRWRDLIEARATSR